jgi:hypothetical protein
VVFTALYLSAGRRHGLAVRGTVLALALAFSVTAVVVIAFELPVPALPFLGLAMLIAHPEARRPPVAERTRGFVAVGVLVAVLAGLYLLR